MNILGIDPGLEGAMAYLDKDGGLHIVDMPTTEITVSKKLRKVVDESALRHGINAFFTLGCRNVILEQVGGLPGQSASAAFNFGVGYGLLKMAIMSSGMALHPIPAVTWKRAMRAPSDKKASIARASELMPNHAHFWDSSAKGSVAQKSGRAEAAMMALYGKKVLGD